MRILLLCHAFNSLSQRVFAELEAAGHELSVELDIRDDVTRQALELFEPDALVAPFLKRRIPDDIWQAVPCLIVHPGPPGDRGPNALDWAILDHEPRWGVSVIKATGELDGGPVLAFEQFAMRCARKSSLYRREATEAAVRALFRALENMDGDRPVPRPASDRWRDAVPAEARRIDWAVDDTATVLNKIHSADGAPGVLDRIGELDVRLFDARPEHGLTGPPGTLLARCRGAVCRATVDGAVWIGHLKLAETSAFKTEAVDVLGAVAAELPEVPASLQPDSDGRGAISYREQGPVGILEFDFYNGAMSTRDCQALLEAWRHAAAQPTRVIVMAGGADFWSNGMDLNAIEAAPSPADESWNNIRAIDELAEAIIDTTSHLTVSALAGNTAAGGVFLALAADRVWARQGIVLSPHYKNMGNLYGSEYWTYLLPRRVSADNIGRVMDHRLPMLAAQAQALGLVDAVGPGDPQRFGQFTLEQAEALAGPGWERQLAHKRRRRKNDEAVRSLADYRDAELERMRMNFYGFDPSYHVARYRLVRRTPHAWTPLYLARHRSLEWKPRVPAGNHSDRIE